MWLKGQAGDKMEDSAFMGATEAEVGCAQVQAHGGADRDAFNEQEVKAKRSES